MSKGKALGLAVLVSAFGCGGSNSAAPDGGANVGRAGTGGGPTGNRGTGGISPGAGGANAGTAGAAGRGGTSAGTAGAAGTGAAGTGGGSACGDPLTHCAGTMSGAWCVETVSAPPLEGYKGMWANRPDDAWLVGGDQSMGLTPDATGVYAHFDGCAWTVTPRPDLPILTAVWGAAPNDVWIVGARGNAYHWDGSALTAFPLPGAPILTGVHGTSGSDVWAVGSVGIFHWNGSAWAQSSPALGHDVWAVAPSDVWVASGASDALHFDGTTWTATTLTDFGLFTIWGDGTQAYAAGEGEELFRFAGGSWTMLQARGGSSEGFKDIGGLGADVFSTGNQQIFRLSGNTFTPIPDQPPGGYRMVWVSPTQIWFGAGDGTVARRSR